MMVQVSPVTCLKTLLLLAFILFSIALAGHFNNWCLHLTEDFFFTLHLFMTISFLQACWLNLSILILHDHSIHHPYTLLGFAATRVIVRSHILPIFFIIWFWNGGKLVTSLDMNHLISDSTKFIFQAKVNHKNNINQIMPFRINLT